VRDLAALPEDELVVRLGQRGKQLRWLARGEHPHLLVPDEPELVLGETLALDEPVELLDSLLFVLGPMLDRILAHAAAHALAVVSVTLTLTLEGGAEHRSVIKPALPATDRAALLKLLHLYLQAHPPSAAITHIGLAAEGGKQSKVQTGMFMPQTPEPMRLDVTLARLRALVGEERVGSAQLVDSHCPDGFVMNAFGSVQAGQNATATRTRAAVRRCRPPVRVPMQLQGGKPATFVWERSRYMVEQVFGPWHTSGVWWQASHMWAREEWDVHAAREDGERLFCVLAYDLLSQNWVLDGMYD
jgi:protein ImuB